MKITYRIPILCLVIISISEYLHYIAKKKQDPVKRNNDAIERKNDHTGANIDTSSDLENRVRRLDEFQNEDHNSFERVEGLVQRTNRDEEFNIEVKPRHPLDYLIEEQPVQLDVRRNSPLADTDNEDAEKDPAIGNMDVNVGKDHFVLMSDQEGRLGNWMFQFAAAYSIAKKINYKFIMNSSHPFTRVCDLPNVSNMSIDNVMVVNQSEWDNQTWHKNTDYLAHNLTFNGYFQRFPYFINNSKEIREIFKAKPKFLEIAQTFLDANTPKNKTLIGIHARRGDFLRLHAFHRGKLGGDKVYFNKAMSYYRNLYSDAIFVVVSDDQPWCQQNIVGPDVRYSPFTKPMADFSIMTLCDHTIITSGTFSWWAGWLAGGTVVYLSDYPIPGSYVEREIIGRREYYYFPEWIPMENGIRKY